MVRGAQQNAAQSQEISRYLEVNDLARSLLLDLIGAGPAGGQNVGSLSRLTLMHKVAPGSKNSAALVQTLQHGKLIF